MSKYINADEYAKKLDYAWENYFRQSQSTEGIETALSILEDMPAADARENIHGKWVSSYRTWEFTFECSVCGKVAYEESNFCPNCGADMRGESNDK